MIIYRVKLKKQLKHRWRNEIFQINKEAQMIAFVDPQPIGKIYAIEKNIFPSKE